MKIISHKLSNYIEKPFFICEGFKKIFQFSIYEDKKKIGKFEISIEQYITLEDFYIKPDYRNLGYGNIVIQQINMVLNKMSKDFNITELFLLVHTYDDSFLDNTALKNFYIKNLNVFDISADEYEINLFKDFL